MKEQKNKLTRKKFLSWTAGLASLLTVPAIFRFSSAKKEKPKGTAKMLTRDGQLVEVDLTGATANRKKISNEDIHSWVNQKPHLNTDK